MKQKIRFYLTIAVVLSIATSMLAGVYLSYNSLVKQTRHMLQVQAYAYVENGRQVEGIRYTKVALDGRVLYDSMREATDMDNHLDREEVREALSTGEGFSIRRSATIDRDTIYYAISDAAIVSRLSMDTSSVWAVIKEALPSTIGITFILGLVVLALTNWLTDRLIRPIESAFVPESGFVSPYDELIPLASLLDEKETGLKQALATVKHSKEEMELITANMREGVIYTDSSRVICFVNPAAFNLFRIKEHNCLGRDLVYFSTNKKLAKAVKTATEDKLCLKNIKLDNRTLRVSATAVYTNGDYAGVISVISDVTEEIKAEKIRRDFTANVTHELKTPLTSIMGYSELIAGGVPAEEAKSFASVIMKEANHLLALINDVLKIAELENGVNKRNDEEINLLSVAREQVDALDLQARSKKLSISVKGEDCVVLTDYESISQLVRNLCDNAVRYNVDGGKVDVIVNAEERSITVTDSGVGIPEKDKERIFERFYRVDKGRSLASGGTGLGLSIVKHIVEKLGAELSLDSKEGTGTTIKVRFTR